MTRTILRIKRRRTEDPLPFIRLEGLNASAATRYSGARIDMHGREGVSDGINKKRNRGLGEEPVKDPDSTCLSQFLDAEKKDPKVSQSSSVLWKRLEPLEGETGSCRVVDALLENSEVNDGPQNKRRKLTLLETSSPSRIDLSLSHKSTAIRRKPPLKVLDPLTRMVDDSLQEVHSGMKPISQHYQFITMDPALAVHDTTKWLQWCHSSGGNILHACALWNDVEVAGELLQLPNLAGVLCESLDGDGRTPYEVAQLSGHNSVCEVLEAFGGDTTNYVYDIFCLEESSDPDVDDSKLVPTSVELTSGVAYWSPDGELMLEADDKNAATINDEDYEDIDSNCEEYDANDYPDGEDDYDTWAYDAAYEMDEQNAAFQTRNAFASMMRYNDDSQEACALDRNLLQSRLAHAYHAGDEEPGYEYAD